MNSTRPPGIAVGLMPGGHATAVLLDAERVATVAACAEGAGDRDRAGRQRTESRHGAALTRAASATTFDQAGPPLVPGPLRRAGVLVGDLMGAVAIVLCIPFVILAIGTPVALCLRLLLWVGGLL